MFDISKSIKIADEFSHVSVCPVNGNQVAVVVDVGDDFGEIVQVSTSVERVNGVYKFTVAANRAVERATVADHVLDVIRKTTIGRDLKFKQQVSDDVQLIGGSFENVPANVSIDARYEVTSTDGHQYIVVVFSTSAVRTNYTRSNWFDDFTDFDDRFNRIFESPSSLWRLERSERE